MRRPAIPLLLLVTLIAAACGRVTQGGTNTNWVDCKSTADCPDGLVCSEKKCVGPGSVLGVDGTIQEMRLPESGTRLTTSADMIDGRILQVRPTHDEVRDVDCAPAIAADGVPRCLPSGVGKIEFTDPDCTQPVIRLIGVVGSEDPACFTPPEYATSGGGNDLCSTPTRVFAGGAELPAPPTVYSSGASCVAGGPQSTDRFFEAIESPPGDWVAVERSVRAVTPDLGVVTWTGEDGSTFQNGLTLLPSDEPCEMGTLETPGDLRCVPRAMAYHSALHVDPACGDTLFQAPACSNSRTAIQWDGGACPQLLRLARFEPVPPNTSFQWPGLSGGCESMAPALVDTTFAYGTAGQDIPPSSFPHLETSPGPAAPSLVVTSGGVPLAFSKPRCSPRPFDDGHSYCAGAPSTTLGSYFTDPACTDPLFIVAMDETCGPSVAPESFTPGWVAEGGAAAGCDPAVAPAATVRQVLGEYSGPVYWKNPTCERHPAPDGSIAEYFFRLGAPVAPATVLSPVVTVKL